MPGELVLVTGASSSVGGAILRAILEAGYRVRGTGRRIDQLEELRSVPSLQMHEQNLELVQVPDMAAPDAFKDLLQGVTYVVHTASPMPTTGVPSNGETYDSLYVQPAVKGALSLLETARRYPSVKRIIITSSMSIYLSEGGENDAEKEKMLRDDDIQPVSTSPINDPLWAYRASKLAAYHAAVDFVKSEKPQYEIVHIIPSFVVGRNEKVHVSSASSSAASDVMSGSNGIILCPLFGIKSPQGVHGATVHVDDVAKAHTEALTKADAGGQNYILNSPDWNAGATYDDALDIVKRRFPDEVASGVIPMGGTLPTIPVKIDSSKAERAFGKFKGFEEQVVDAVGQYVEMRKAGK
ncbi:NAD(P)-binding protein [Xylona heveae TC161]|uniref:NAD(P)-binding protein n=1 Tax=Xylona heveae (strain CBS 132557 / TC161) TaxID=1328760 RepID=A0A165A001_XYLHT|nr:NAD(P)-binding protein [Xylona heveae TC161]KZF19758.1 NAD(P)-binding protein [Xylona heveae TC161]